MAVSVKEKEAGTDIRISDNIVDQDDSQSVVAINDKIKKVDEDDDDDEPYVYTGITTWKGRIWDAWDKPKEERWFLFKLDITLLSMASIGVFLRYLDQSNINNAFVSGMREELSLYGQELNYANTCFTVGYAVMQIPSNILLSKLKRPHIYVASLEVGWSILTFCSSEFSGPTSMYIIRLLVGLFEAGHFPAVMYIASAWYRKEELSKRISIIQLNTATGPLISGFLQSAAYSGLNGVHGRSGWRWLFIVDGIISLPLALLVYFLLPDTPSIQKPNFIFTEKEIKLARKRVPQEIKVYVSYKWSSVKEWISSWQIYYFCAAFTLEALSALPSGSFQYWLKSYPNIYSVTQINNYSSTVYAVRILSTVIQGFISDDYLKGRRWILIVFNMLWMFSICVVLTVIPTHPSNDNRGPRFATYVLSGVFNSGAQAWTWVNEATLGDPAKRAFVGGAMNAICYAFQAWVPIVLFPTHHQPFVDDGNIGSAVFSMVAVILAIGGAYIEFLKKDKGFFRSVYWKPEQDESEISSDEAVEKVDIEGKPIKSL